MTKEIHVYTHRTEDYEQAFVFYVRRDEEERTLDLEELWLTTIVGEHEIRSRLDLQNLIGEMCRNVGGNTPPNGVSIVLDIFNEVIPEKIIHEMELNEIEQQIDTLSKEHSVNREIIASEYALREVPNDMTIEEIVNAKLKNITRG
jgi:hypothetical protein